MSPHHVKRWQGVKQGAQKAADFQWLANPLSVCLLVPGSCGTADCSACEALQTFIAQGGNLPKPATAGNLLEQGQSRGALSVL